MQIEEMRSQVARFQDNDWEKGANDGEPLLRPTILHKWNMDSYKMHIDVMRLR